jgi:hypothetical protein
MLISQFATEHTALSPPLWGRLRPPSAAVLLENAEAKLRLWKGGRRSWLSPVLTLPHKGEGNGEMVPSLQGTSVLA